MMHHPSHPTPPEEEGEREREREREVRICNKGRVWIYIFQIFIKIFLKTFLGISGLVKCNRF
jgi:hypothetical protein